MTETTSPLQEIIPADRIAILKPVKLDSIFAGSIAVVEKGEKEVGEVISIGGAGVNKEGEPLPYPINLAPGDIVAYRKYGEGKFYIGSEQVTFVGFDDIYAILKRTPLPKLEK